MKHIYNILGIALMAAAIMSCGGQQQQQQKQGTKFAPKERTSSMTASERRAAIAEKQAELLGGLNLDTLLYSHGVKFSIVQPRVQGEDITQDISDRISMKLLQMACQNGISGLGTNPTFVFGTEIAQTGRAATGTTPQKMTVQYQLTFKVMNAATGDVYATATQDVMGVGNSFVEANQNFVKEIKNTPEIQKMLQTASERIVKWYNENLQAVKNQVEKAEGEGNYDLALAILTSIPEQSSSYKYVAEKQDALLKGMLHQHAATMLGDMTAAMASAGEEFDPSIGAYFKLIPADTPEHAKAQELYNKYTQQCKARRDALEAKAERDEQAARDLEKFKMMQEHEKELAEIEADKIKSKCASMASAKAAEAQAKASRKSGGLFGSIGDAISGTFDRVFKVADVAGALITDKLDLGDYMEDNED
ncbi:MAG: hypothetical protein IJ612_01090 [Prevotella sp.]|nr:hypothetical protein [Prevotella sp.]